jgi:hypothetical protein
MPLFAIFTSSSVFTSYLHLFFKESDILTTLAPVSFLLAGHKFVGKLIPARINDTRDHFVAESMN